MKQFLRQANVNYNQVLLNFGMCTWRCWERNTYTHRGSRFRGCVMIRLSLQRRSWEPPSWWSRAAGLFLWELWFLGLRVGIFLLWKNQITGKTATFPFFMRMWPQLFRGQENSYLPPKVCLSFETPPWYCACWKRPEAFMLRTLTLSDFSRGGEWICWFVFLTNLSFQNMWFALISAMWFPYIYIYIYIYMLLCSIYTHTYIWVYRCIYTYVSLYIHTYVYMCAYIYTYTHNF